MNQARYTEALLFWGLLVLAAALLVPSLLLPAWLEYEAQRDRAAAADRYITALEQRLAATHKQIEHIEHDPSYVLRIAEQEFGESMRPPDVEVIPVAPSPDDEFTPPADDAATDDDEDASFPVLAAFLERGVERYPFARAFIEPGTRYVLMGLGGVLLIIAVVLLGRPRPAARE